MVGAITAAVILASSTAYCPGESSTLTASGRQAQIGWVANNQFALGTWIEMRKPRLVMGRRWFRIMDRIGSGSDLDYFSDCGWMESWGRRTVTFSPVPKSHLYRGKPVEGWRAVSARRGGKLVWRPR